MEKEWKICLILLCILLLWGCKKWVEVPVPRDRVIASRVFETDAKATAAVTAIYGTLINGSANFANTLTSLYAGLSADELLRFTPSATETEFMEAALSPQNTTVASLWRTAYQVVYFSNAVLEGISASPSLSGPVRDRLEGEARFLRAFSYSYLVAFFGDVPLVRSTTFTENLSLPRTPAAKIYGAIMEDLVKAKALLPEGYIGGEKNRPNKWAAAALLARVHLYNRNWQEAEAEASAVIDAGIYTPLSAPNNVFLKNSREAIFQLSPTAGMLRETGAIRPTGTPPAPQYYCQPALVTAFEPGDNRRLRWLDSVAYLGTKYFYPAKYRNTAAAVTEYYTVLRLAEVLLIRAEARAQQAKLPEAVADINTVRTRAALPPLLLTIGLPQVMAAIEGERRSELFAEWGHRWFDLKRWNRATAVLQPLKPDFSETDLRYPVPADEITANPSLTQNPGY